MGGDVCCSCAEVPAGLLPRTGNKTGIDVGLQVCLVTADGQIVARPRHQRTAERAWQEAQQRVARRTKGRHRHTKALALVRRF
jgi:putative transposase